MWIDNFFRKRRIDNFNTYTKNQIGPTTEGATCFFTEKREGTAKNKTKMKPLYSLTPQNFLKTPLRVTENLNILLSAVQIF